MKLLPVAVLVLAVLGMVAVLGFQAIGVGGRVWALIQIAVFLAAGGATAYLVVKTTESGAPGKVSGELALARADAVRASGRLLISERTGGRLGDTHFSYPLFKVSVYPGGIVLNPGGSDDRTIFANEIQSVESVEAFAGLGVSSLRIRHHSPDVPEHVTFSSHWESALGTAIRKLGSH